MRMIYDSNVLGEDFIELIISPKEYEKLFEKGLVCNFPNPLNDERELNIFLRVSSQ